MNLPNSFFAETLKDLAKEDMIDFTDPKQERKMTVRNAIRIALISQSPADREKLPDEDKKWKEYRLAEKVMDAPITGNTELTIDEIGMIKGKLPLLGTEYMGYIRKRLESAKVSEENKADNKKEDKPSVIGSPSTI